jgi:sec-independent protein translocase protein TatB
VFDIGIGEFILLGVVGLIVLGPDRLPTYAAQAARFLRQFRQQVDAARATVVDAVEIDPKMLKDLRDLDPRRAFEDLDRDFEPDVEGVPLERLPSTPVLLDPDTT